VRAVQQADASGALTGMGQGTVTWKPLLTPLQRWLVMHRLPAVPVHAAVGAVRQSVPCPPACTPACMHACLPACLHACLSARLPACTPACLHVPARLPACTPALPARLPACTPACLHACPSTGLFSNTGAMGDIMAVMARKAAGKAPRYSLPATTVFSLMHIRGGSWMARLARLNLAAPSLSYLRQFRSSLFKFELTDPKANLQQVGALRAMWAPPCPETCTRAFTCSGGCMGHLIGHWAQPCPTSALPAFGGARARSGSPSWRS
jgi:hypothetical protein